MSTRANSPLPPQWPSGDTTMISLTIMITMTRTLIWRTATTTMPMTTQWLHWLLLLLLRRRRWWCKWKKMSCLDYSRRHTAMRWFVMFKFGSTSVNSSTDLCVFNQQILAAWLAEWNQLCIQIYERGSWFTQLLAIL